MQKLLTLATDAYRKYKFGPPPNLEGDRDIEFAFVAANIPKGGKVLDFGSGNTPLSLVALLGGAEVTAIDLLPNRYKFASKIKFIQGDILKTNLKKNYFDTIINCSSIEHVGLAGRYGVRKNLMEGDIKAMKILWELLKENGIMLMTIPVGKNKVFEFRHRVYGVHRLPKILSQFKIIKQEFWTKDNNNKWFITSRTKALSFAPKENFYNLGCFVLRKPTQKMRRVSHRVVRFSR